MGFCDRAAVRQQVEGKFVCLVGSGPGVLDNPKGFVDSHEVVMRVNNYALSGAITGKRTDIFYSFFGTSIKKRREDLIRDGVKLCVCKCPDAQFMESAWHLENNKPRGVDFRYIYQERRDWWFCDTYVPSVAEFLVQFDLLGGHVPTTGFAALLDVLSFRPRSVYMTGFDFFQSNIHNVNQRWRRANPDDPIGHVPDAERTWLAENIERLPVTMDAQLERALHREEPPKPRLVRTFRPRAAA